MKIKFTKSHVFSILVANMIGTGVFTSLGFQVIGISSGFAILLLWVIGGLMALLGSLCYSMLGIALPRSGGEYNYLSQIYHPIVGFLSGWVSLIIGFSAPIAAAAFAFGIYLTNFSKMYLHQYNISINPLHSAITIVFLLTIINVFNKKIGAEFQKVFTITKVAIILLIIIVGIVFSTNTNVNYTINAFTIKNILSPEFCIAMFFVTYSYSGWNSVSYISGEIVDANRNLPFSLITGTLFVCILYVLLNFVFLKVIPIDQMAGVLDIGYLFSNKVLGISFGGIMSLAICVLLISSINSMIIVGPRVSMIIGEDYKKLKFFSLINSKEVPYVSIIIQSILAILYILTASFESLIIYVGFIITVFSFLTVLGLFFYSKDDQKTKDMFKSFGYPFVPIIFLMFNLWIMIYGLIYKPTESLIGLTICFSGLFLYLFVYKKRIIL
ncbi:MAG: amino acid permease [Bacteroidales bacterium]